VPELAPPRVRSVSENFWADPSSQIPYCSGPLQFFLIFPNLLRMLIFFSMGRVSSAIPLQRQVPVGKDGTPLLPPPPFAPWFKTSMVAWFQFPRNSEPFSSPGQRVPGRSIFSMPSLLLVRSGRSLPHPTPSLPPDTMRSNSFR